MSDSDYYNCSSDSHSNKNNSCGLAPVIVREGGNEDSEKKSDEWYGSEISV